MVHGSLVVEKMHGAIFIVVCAECFDCMFRDLEIVILLYNEFENKNPITAHLKNCPSVRFLFQLTPK